MRSPRFLHVANGTSTTNTLEAAGLPGPTSIWADPLHDGPVPAGVSDEELLVVRTHYLAGVADEAAAADPANDLRRWRQVIDDHDAYDELVLWFEHDLFDQLNLIQLLSWIHNRLPAQKTVSLICVDSFPGRPAFRGLGELSPGELASLWPARRPVTESQYAVAQRAWRAFREPTPLPIDELRRDDITALPYLSRALTRLLQEYPSARDGLSRTERRLLELTAQRPIHARTAFPRMHDGEDAYYISSETFADVIETLSRTTPPLVTDDDDAMRATDAGREVLSGRRDRVACGIDRWIGGVHLQTGAVRWRWNDQRQSISGG